MRITQCHTVLRFFKPSVFKKYGFRDYTNPNTPAVFWGLYPGSMRKLISHMGFAIVVWRGSDAMNTLKNASFVQFLRQNTGRIKHVAISNYIENDLTRSGIPFKSIPLTSMTFPYCHLMPQGNQMYMYGAENDGALIKYQAELAKEIALKSGIALLVAHKDKYSRSELVDKAYRSCFLGLRLLTHDGLSNTCAEMGLCGRNMVHNGNLPNSLNFRDTKDILQIVAQQYAHRKEDNSRIAKEMFDYINISREWLQTKYWEDK